MIAIGLVLLSACNSKDKFSQFSSIEASQTNITFQNNLTGQTGLDIIEYLYYYDGGGVAAGDVNNDGLVDLFFTANELPNKLYLNKGNLQFEDITEQAGIQHIENGWSTGVTMADVNGDGFLDIYVSQLGHYKGVKGVNQLYINNGDNQAAQVGFTEQAKAYGLDFVGFGTQASFFDYDNDGDLDVYLLNHAIHMDKSYRASFIRMESDSLAGDRLMRHDDDGTKITFTDVTEQAGIYNSYIGYGLAISTGDINRDGYVDIFISNDFHENDYLYLNNGDGTFNEILEEAFRHTSRSSMGNDMADINNDGLVDIMVLDMLPQDEEILRRSATEDNEQVYDIKLAMGYHDQLVRNTFQLNRGNNLFSDVALLANIHATDWSWTPLIADYDGDGLKDIYVTNGIIRRPNDLDFVRYNAAMQNGMRNNMAPDSLNAALIQAMPSDKTPNYMFKNLGQLSFAEKQKDWGLDVPSWSNGAIYADLDNDGDLDIVVNNTNEVASIFRNNAELVADYNFLKIDLKGENKNTKGVGARVEVWAEGKRQYLEQHPTRGFHSSVSNTLLFGLGESNLVDSLKVWWPGGKTQILNNISTQQHLRLNFEKASEDGVSIATSTSILTPTDSTHGLFFVHQENEPTPESDEQLRPHDLFTQGPAMAVADVNRDGLEDVFIGGAQGQPGALFIQNNESKFQRVKVPDLDQDRMAEDVDALFFDADGDQDLDLYVVSGGGEIPRNSDYMLDRLYLNDGQGGYTKSNDGLPPLIANGSCVASTDFDQDGDLDLFVGTRSVPGRYGLNTTSYLLKNDGQGRFSDVTNSLAPLLIDFGMVSNASWANLDGDGLPELIISGEWMPISILSWDNGQLENITKQANLSATSGWWNTLLIMDIDNDGDMDILGGNLGLNSKIKASESAPIKLYINDFDRNGTLDHILCYEHNGKDLPFATRDELARQIPGFASKFVTYKQFSEITSIEDLFPTEQLANSLILEAQTLASSIFYNDGKGNFEQEDLPLEAQFAPVFAIHAKSNRNNSLSDLVIGGNFNAARLNYGLYDASYGLYLHNELPDRLMSIPLEQSGLVVKGEIRAIETLALANGQKLLLFARNNESTLTYLINH